MIMAKNGQVGGSIDLNELANKIVDLLYSSSETNANSANSAAEKAGANMGEAFMNGFTKEFGDTIDEQTIEAISKLQGKITEVTGKINISLKNVKDFNDNSENLDETDIISQYFDETEKSIDNLLIQVKADIKYRNSKIQKLNEIIKTLPEGLQWRVNNYISSDITREYTTDYKESKNKAKTIVANTLKNAIKENISSFTAIQDKINEHTDKIKHLILMNDFEVLNDEEKDTLKSLYNERITLIQDCIYKLNKAKTYVEYLFKLNVTPDSKILNNMTLCEVEKTVEAKRKFAFKIEEDSEEHDYFLLKSIFGDTPFIDTPKATKSSDNTEIDSNDLKVTNAATTTIKSPYLEPFTIDTPEELVRSVKESSSFQSSGAASMARSAKDVMAEKEALQKKINAAEQKAYNKGFKEGKAQGKASVIDRNAEKIKLLEEEKAMRDIILEKSANSSVDINDMLKELVIQQQKEMNEITDTFYKKDSNKIKSEEFIGELVHIRKIYGSIHEIENFYNNQARLVKFNKNELYEGSSASGIISRKRDFERLKQYVLDIDKKYGLIYNKNIAEAFINKIYDNNTQSLSEMLDMAINNISDKISANEEQSQIKAQDITQDIAISAIKNAQKYFDIEKADGILKKDITTIKKAMI